MNQSISIITVFLNAEQFVQDYFDAVFQGTVLPKEVLIYDGGSTDQTTTIIKKNQKKYHQIKLFQGGNIGFAAGNNLLAEKAVGKYLFILNPDTKIKRKCLEFLANNPHKDTSILIPKQFLYDGTPIIHGVGMDMLGYPALFKKPFFADGAAIFLTTEIFKDLGMFDPDYFVFQEDIDLSWRARLRGVTLILVPRAQLFHYSGGTVSGGAKKEQKHYLTNTFRRYLGERNVLQNLLKNYSTPMLLIVLPINLIINIFEVIAFLITLQPQLAWCYFRAYAYIFKNFFKIMDKRKRVQGDRVISDWQILRDIYLGSSKFKLLLSVGLPKMKK